jgi:RNA polymerase sigma factor for flagellar operon FliA
LGSSDEVSTDSPEVLDRINSELALVEALAFSFRRLMGTYAVVDELTSYGREALLLAARTYDASKGVTFKRWAAFKIKGAMTEAMRSKGPLPKRVYRKLRAIEAADRIYEVAAEEEAAAPLAASPEEADERLGQTLSSAAHAMAIGLLYIKSTDDMLRPVEDRESDSPEELAAEVELARLVQECIDERPENERTLLRRHYFDEITFDEAAKELGLSKSWGSRLHARAIEGLARSLKRRRVTSP